MGKFNRGKGWIVWSLADFGSRAAGEGSRVAGGLGPFGAMRDWMRGEAGAFSLLGVFDVGFEEIEF